MKIEPISNGNLRIWLAETEIKEWGLDKGQRGVRRLVRHALETVGHSSAIRVEAEMIPVDGGWVIVVSPRIHSRLPAVYEVEETALQDVAVRWEWVSQEVAQVYAMDEKYHIVAYGEDTEWLLREYGQPIGGGAEIAAHTAEYGRWLFTMPAPAPQESEGQPH